MSLVLIPLDGSPMAEQALPVGTRLARARQAGVLLVRSVSAHPDPSEQAEAEDYLRRVAGRILDAGQPADTLVAFGDAAKNILAATRAREPALIVMATHGRGGVGRALYGSVADGVLRQAPVPVVMVPAPTGAISPWTTDQPLRILVPLDGSDCSESAIAPVRELAHDTGASIILLRVVPRLATYPVIPAGVAPVVEHDPEAEFARARRYLDGVADRLRGAAGSVAVRCEVGSAAARIADVAAEERADLIAMATHGHAGLTRFVLGSVATGTVQRAGLPVLLVAPHCAGPTARRVHTEARPAPPVGPTVSVTLTPREMDLVSRGLRGLYFRDGTTVEVARSIDDLRGRLRQATPV